MTDYFRRSFFGCAIKMRPLLVSVFLLAILLLSISAPSFAQGKAPAQPKPDRVRHSVTLRDATFHSTSLNRDVHYRILLPANYESSERRYPTLFLLHGLYGDDQNWTTRTNLVNYARDLNLIIAMPDAGNSWYVNSATDPADKFEDFIVKDFITEIDTRYRTIREGYARAVAGLSMGGYAAVKFSLKYPELFAFAGGISAALDASADLDERNAEFREGLRNVFGEPGNLVRSQNDVFVLLANTGSKKLPYFYLDCGSDDMFLDVNRKFAARLQQLRIPYEAHELPGGHTWNYWDGAIDRFLSLLVKSSFTGDAPRPSMNQPMPVKH
jgi:S-formylglutathione hydrolase FrmB